MSRIIEVSCFYVMNAPGAFRVYVARHDDGRWYSSAVVWDVSGVWATETREMHVHTESFTGKDRVQALDKAINYIKERYGEECDLGDPVTGAFPINKSDGNNLG